LVANFLGTALAIFQPSSTPPTKTKSKTHGLKLHLQMFAVGMLECFGNAVGLLGIIFAGSGVLLPLFSFGFLLRLSNWLLNMSHRVSESYYIFFLIQLYQVVYSCVVVVTALFSKLLLRKQISIQQWIAILSISCGLAVSALGIQHQTVPNGKPKKSNKNK
jgi:hypothetical protein